MEILIKDCGDVELLKMDWINKLLFSLFHVHPDI